jgi:predicted dehydrogenase
MVNVGILGIGFMGVTHYKALQKVKGARAAAICTRDEKKLAGDWSMVQGNFGDAGGVQDLKRVARYREIDELLADDSIDLVDVCLPTPMHREVTIKALRAGKNVLVEKPIALTLKDADAMIGAARETGKLLMVAHVLRFVPAFAEARELALSGKYGALMGVHLKRIIGRKSPEIERNYFDRSGGPLLDLHIHDTDFMMHLCGTPARVLANAHVAPNGDVLYFNAEYFYDGRSIGASAQCGAVGQPPVTFEHGFDFFLEKATLRYNSLRDANAILLCAGGKQKELAPRRKEAFQAQLQHAVDCVRDGRESDIISAQNARTSLAVCLHEKQSALSGKVVNVKS